MAEGKNNADTFNVIKMQDMTSFKWVMINILGHDFMHDFLLNANRTKKGQVLDGSKKVSIINKVEKTCKSIAKYLKIKRLAQDLGQGGGGYFDNPPDINIDYDDEKLNEGQIIERLGSELMDSGINVKHDDSSAEKELAHMETLLKMYEDLKDNTKTLDSLKQAYRLIDSEEDKQNITKYIEDYFDSLYDKDGERIKPKILSVLAQSLVSATLSPLIKDMLDHSFDYKLKIRNATDAATTAVSEENPLFVSEEYDDEKSIDIPDDRDEEIIGKSYWNEDNAEKDASAIPEYSEDDGDESRNASKTDNDDDNGSWEEINEIQNKFRKSFGRLFQNELTLNDGENFFTINKKTLKDITVIESLGDSENDDPELLTLGEIGAIKEDEDRITTIKELEDKIVKGEYSIKSYFTQTKNILLRNYINSFNSGKEKSYRKENRGLLFKRDSDQNIIFNNDPIENTVLEVEVMLNNKFNIDLIGEDSVDDVDFKILDKSSNPVGEFKGLLVKFGIDPVETWKGVAPATEKRRLRNLYLNAMLAIHPDRSGNEAKVGEDIQHSWDGKAGFIISAYERFKSGNVSGGARVQKGGAIDNNKLFSAMNTLLNKAIIENSLVLMDCVKGDKTFGYFPEIKDGSLKEEFKIKTHKGFRPVFENIFHGKELQTFLKTPIDVGGGEIKFIEGNTVKWENLKSHAPLEVRKLIARRILLNMQILILYQKCMPSHITTNSLFEALELKSDNRKRKNDIMESRGFITEALQENKGQDDQFINKFGYDNLGDFKNKISLTRTKFFGMLYNNTEHKDIPDWIKKSNTEDDMLQNGFNIVLINLLSDMIYQIGNQPGIGINQMPIKADIPNAGGDSMIRGDGSNAFVINNAVPLIYPQLKKADQDRFGFLNLTGIQSRNAQFCPVTSIADSQPLCSIKTKNSFKETAPRALNYSMEMGLEAPIQAGTYSYYVRLRKVSGANNDDYKYFISGELTGPGFLYQIGDNNTVFDLKLGPLSAVNTFYEILKNISIITKKATLTSAQQRKFSPRVILRSFFESNIEMLMKAGIKKSIGDYGQEFTALSKYGATLPAIYREKNRLGGTTKTIPYNGKGNAFRIMVANDRPSAYRGIFMLLFADQNTINTRSMLGYYRNKPETPTDPSKLTLVHGYNALKKDGDTWKINQEVEDAFDVEQISSDQKDIETKVIKEAKKKGGLKNVLKLKRRSTRLVKPSSRTISMFLRRYPEMKTWSKDRGIVLRPDNWRKRVQEFVVYFNALPESEGRKVELGGKHRYVLRGGKNNTKKNRLKKQKTTKKLYQKQNKKSRKIRSKKLKKTRKRY